MDLNRKNYYSNEADWQYMSVSQFKDFMKCEAATLAKLKEEWKPNSDDTALIVGNYVHTYFESELAHEEYIDENRQVILKKDGTERAAFVQAIDMIEALEYDDFFNFVYQGEKEVILTGDLFGTEWKARIDCFNYDKGYFVDLKTTRSLSQRYWSERYGGYVSFAEEYGYIMQMYVYKQLLEKKFNKEVTPYIFAVTKESPPDISAIQIHPARYDFEHYTIEEKLPHILRVKMGEDAPTACGKCEYCRKNKRLSGFIEIEDLLNT
ncbi:PD-(D/E)XK nuclease-like domain-containing protein [Enterococcus dongliensis]|uniref:PD-(D/E)XK nuclease-like domain-containing protein n=1 Tax=Enterococcus dongliensis TaxID=2559925 RepID=UPI0035DB56C9